MTQTRLASCDWIRIFDKDYPLANSPLRSYFAAAGIEDPFVYQRNGSPIAYVDRYEIKDNLLYLRHIDGEGGIERFFPGCAGGLIVYWYSGTLNVLTSVGRLYDTPTRIVVDGGVVNWGRSDGIEGVPTRVF